MDEDVFISIALDFAEIRILTRRQRDLQATEKEQMWNGAKRAQDSKMQIKETKKQLNVNGYNVKDMNSKCEIRKAVILPLTEPLSFKLALVPRAP